MQQRFPFSIHVQRELSNNLRTIMNVKIKSIIMCCVATLSSLFLDVFPMLSFYHNFYL